MIEISGLWKRLDNRDVLAGVDLTVPDGQILALVGPSGAGKSVLLRHLVGLLGPDRGTVRVDGVDVDGADSATLDRLRRHIGYVFQDGALLDSITVRENLLLALHDPPAEPAAREQLLHRALQTVNLARSILDRYPAELSGGMRKRVGVARAVVHRPDLILYDEPTTGLDPQNVKRIGDVILRTRAQFDATCIMVTHEMAAVRQAADRVVLLTDGRARFDGPTDTFFTSEAPVVRAFLGRA